MKRYLTLVAAAAMLASAASFAPSALAGNSFAVSIGVPGFAIGYANRGGYVVAYAPPVSYSPAAVHYAPPPYSVAPVVFGAAVVAYGGYRPWYRSYDRPYYRHY